MLLLEVSFLSCLVRKIVPRSVSEGKSLRLGSHLCGNVCNCMHSHTLKWHPLTLKNKALSHTLCAQAQLKTMGCILDQQKNKNKYCMPEKQSLFRQQCSKGLKKPQTPLIPDRGSNPSPLYPKLNKMFRLQIHKNG